MADPNDLTDTIADLAAAPAAMETDGQKVQEQSLADVIAADKYLAAKASASKRTRGLRFTKLVPPGGD